MHGVRFLLVMLLALVIIRAAPATAAFEHNVKSERHLRAEESVDAPDTEERSFMSGIAKWAKMKYWVGFKKSNEYVLKKLKLKGLTGSALKNHPNYKILQKFWYQLERRQLSRLADDYTPLSDVWIRLGLDQLDEGAIRASSAYRAYVNYVRIFEHRIFHFTPGSPKEYVSYGELEIQQETIGKVWAEAGRSKRYVDRMKDMNQKAHAVFLESRGKKVIDLPKKWEAINKRPQNI